MAKNCDQCSQRKGRRYYYLDVDNRICKLTCCDKCKKNYTLPGKFCTFHAKDLHIEQITNALEL